MSKKKQDKERVPEHCLNCYYPLGTSAGFCPKCGQKRTDGKVPLWEFASDIFKDVFNVDSKIFWTPIRLLQPGFLTKAYFEGKHKRYTKPFRLFLILAVAYFAILVFTYRDSFEANIMNQSESKFEKKLKNRELHLELDTVRLDLERKYDSSLVNELMDSLHVKMRIEPDSIWQDSIDFLDFLNFQLTDEFNFKLAKKDAVDMPIGELLNHYEIKGFRKRLWVRQHLRMHRESQDLVSYWIGQIPWALFLAIPFFAAIMKLLYIRRRRYFVEHLVFGYHFHAFIMLVLLGLLIAGNFTDVEEWYGFAAIGFAIYLYIAMMKYYKQGWFKTLIKYFFLLFWYTISLFVTGIIVMITSSLLY